MYKRRIIKWTIIAIVFFAVMFVCAIFFYEAFLDYYYSGDNCCVIYTESKSESKSESEASNHGYSE